MRIIVYSNYLDYFRKSYCTLSISNLTIWMTFSSSTDPKQNYAPIKLKSQTPDLAPFTPLMSDARCPRGGGSTLKQN